MEAANFFALKSLFIDRVLLWTRVSQLGEMLFAGSWLLFSAIFAKEDIRTVIKKWRWVIPFICILPVALYAFLFLIHNSMSLDAMRLIRLGQAAKFFHIALLIIVIATLVKLENTFRSSSGLDRWRIKYMIFGIGAILAFYIYILSQRLLYNVIDLNDIYIMSAAIIAGNCMMVFAIIRNKIVDGDIYVSRKVIYSSFSLIAIGLYTIVIALSAQLLKSFDIHKDLRLDVLLIFFAAVVLIVVFYKESFRRKTKAFINRQFKKSKYVYQDEWLAFSTELSKKVSTQEICESFLVTLSERIFVKYTSIWLTDENQVWLHHAASRNMEPPSFNISTDDKIIRHLKYKNQPLSKTDIFTNRALLPVSEEIEALFERTNAELLVPLVLVDRWVGLLTLGKLQTGDDYDEIEDFGLLKSIAAHAASAISNARLFEETMRAGELQAFHRLSSFMMHDLKNSTAMLSMVVQNARQHFQNPEFQKDAMQTITAAVARMEKMINSLTNLSDQLELNLKYLDLNELVNEAVGSLAFDDSKQVAIEKKLTPIPRFKADADELNKVVHNLLINAYDALNADGHISVSTYKDGDQAILSVSDNGSGITREFISDSLFKPFRSTKKKGLGIGLYQCKTIVEGHGGWIEVESKPGKGTTFFIHLPIEPG